MNEIWNNIDLKRPPLITLPATSAHFVSGIHVNINKYFRRYASQEVELAQTAALLSRLMARRKNSFRRMIGFRAICKLNAALCRLLRVDLPRELERFRGALPDIAPEDETFAVELPTRQCIDYLLVRLITVQRIHIRIRDCCVQAADYFSKMMRTNFFMEINTLLLAVFAKLYSLSAMIGNKCVQLYDQLLPHRMAFPLNVNAVDFLPANVELPARLEAFVNPKVEDSANSGSNTSKDINLQISTSLAPVVSKLQQKSDLGTEVQRAPISTSSSSMVAVADTTFNIAELTTIEDVQSFIVAENRARKSSPQKCITKEILKHEWLGAQKLFERKLNANEHKKALSIFRKFIASKI